MEVVCFILSLALTLCVSTILTLFAFVLSVVALNFYHREKMGLSYTGCLYEIPYARYISLYLKFLHFGYISWYRIGKHRANFLYPVDKENFKFQVTFLPENLNVGTIS